MKKNAILFGSIMVVLIIIIIALLILLVSKNNQSANAISNNTQNTTITSYAVSNNTQSYTPSTIVNPEQAVVQTQTQAFENSYMKLKIPSDWSYTEVANGAINITKGNYILYISPNTHQTSGAGTGRFDEIETGAPSADAVITMHPTGPCGTLSKSPVFAEYSRNDFYVDATETKTWCNKPTNSSNVWYFSFIGDGYFNYYNYPGEDIKGFVITMSYNSNDVNSLPKKDDPNLNDMLNEMTDIAKSLEIKHGI